jgi:subtilisin family serine protease
MTHFLPGGRAAVVRAAAVGAAFLSLNVAAADFTKQQAMAALPPQAATKAETKFLARLLDNASNDVIVEFSSRAEGVSPAASVTAQLELNRAKFTSLKQQVTGTFAPIDIQIVRDFDALPMTVLRVKSRRALVQLLSNPNVEFVHENKAHTHTLAQSLPLINQPQAIATGRQGTGTTVAILDTGVNFTLPAFGSCTQPGVPAGCRVVAALDTAPSDGQLDADGHGTNVAAIAAGVAPATRIAGIDVFTGNSAYTADIITGINWAINNKTQFNIVSMNLSLGVRGVKYTNECTSSWARVPFANARAAGILPIVASGNDAFPDGVAEPACAPGAVRVGAVYDANVGARSYGVCSDSATSADRITCFSNGGNLLTLLAPGALITAGGITMSGTSQAAPHIAGAVAVLRAFDAAPNDTLDKTVERMTRTGRVIADSRAGAGNRQHPRLDLLAAVSDLAQPPQPPAPQPGLSWLPSVLGILLGD